MSRSSAIDLGEIWRSSRISSWIWSIISGEVTISNPVGIAHTTADYVTWCTQTWRRGQWPPIPPRNYYANYLLDMKIANWYSYILDWYANDLINIHTSFIDIQMVCNWSNYYASQTAWRLTLFALAPRLYDAHLVAVLDGRHLAIWRTCIFCNMAAIFEFFTLWRLAHYFEII